MSRTRTLLLTFALSLVATVAAAGDVSIQDVDTSAVKCGRCPGEVVVEVKNRGSRLSSSYTVWVELRVVPNGNTHNSKTFKERFSGGLQKDEVKRVRFRNVKLLNCVQEASTFDAKVYVTGGNYRDPNQRNNRKSVSLPIRNRCPRGGDTGGSGGGHGHAENDKGKGAALPDLYPTSFRPNKNLCCGGKGHNIRVPVKNRGSRDIKKSIELELKVTPPDGPAKTYKTRLPRGLKANRTGAAMFRGVKFEDCDGYYSFELKIDPRDRIKEADESNNSATPRVRFSKSCK